MGRCKKKRCCRWLETERIFKPIKIPLIELEILEIEADEFEALRLCDLENLTQIEASEKMEISRGTIQRLLNRGRSKLMQALLHNKAVKIKNQEKIK